jgi:cation:H+ antiporter
LFGYFVYYTYKYAKEQQSKNIFKLFLEKEKPKWNLSKSIFYSLLGLAFIAIGSELAVTNCVNIAEAMHVSQKIITMVILVVGTSTPELIMAVTAVKKDEFDIIIGNIVGTNIFNIGFVLTLPVLIFGGFSTPSFNSYDMIIMIIAGLLIYIFAKDDKKIDKTEGLIMITIFIIYYAYLILV